MQIIASKTNPPLKSPHQLIAIPTWQDQKIEIPNFEHLNQVSLNQWLNSIEFKAKSDQLQTYPLSSGQQTLLLIGLGKAAEYQSSDLYQFCLKIYQQAQKIKAQQIILNLQPFSKLQLAELSQTIALNFKLQAYQFDKYKEKPNSNSITEIHLLSSEPNLSELKKYLHQGQLVASGVNQARDLVNEVPQHLYPRTLARVAQSITNNSPQVSLQIWGKEDLTEMGMRSLLAVAQGSRHEPRLIHLKYQPKDIPNPKKISLVGKGITFDSGGLSLKPSTGQESMKADMAGAATILGLFKIIKHLNLPLAVEGIIAAAENMPSSSAIKPGDIIKTYNGKTVEILNTDAEGRLVLADALPYAAESKPDVLIDLATLTGAAVVALGEEIAALFSNDKNLEQNILQAGKSCHEQIWPLPLVKNYQKLLKSDWADLRNIATSRYGGSITAALFLQNFVPAKQKWAHLDIAGPGWSNKAQTNLPAGGTGFGVQTLLKYLQSY